MSLAFDLLARFTAPGAEPFTVEADLEVPAGETLVVLGPSGSGKTLLLETLGGFHSHEGRVSFDRTDLTDTPPEEREFGFVFQDYALFPHMTVRGNVAFGERYHDDTRAPDELLASLGVAGLADRYPPTLSGGERQRVALARSLLVRPRALLLDEPLAALDVPTRERLRDDLADVLADVTAVGVTHNRTTARALADRVAVMCDGRVVQAGPVETVFGRPATPFVASFVGANCLPGAALDGSSDHTETVAVRPEHVELVGTEEGVPGTVTRTVREDAATRVTVALDGDGTTVTVFADDPPARGERVGVRVPEEHVIGLDRSN
ncbi:MAG: ABC transporter ATP-binding protein [Haloarculaceae archaeon]